MTSKAPSPTHERLLALLDRYASRVMVRSVVAQALASHGLSPSELGARDISAVAEEAMKGLRTLCQPSELPDLMVDLAELCDAEIHALPARRALRPSSQPPPRGRR